MITGISDFGFYPKMAVSRPLTGFVLWFAETPFYSVFGCVFIGPSCQKSFFGTEKKPRHGNF